MYFLFMICMLISLVSILLENNNRLKLKWPGIGLFLITIIIMVNASNKIGDLFNYSNAYQRIGNNGIVSKVDLGYSILMFIANKIGLDFFQFKLFIISLAMFLIYKTLTKYTNYSSFFLFFYLMHSMFMDGTQLRNFLAFAIVIYAIPYLFEKNKSWVWYVILILISSTIHLMTLAYLLFVWIKLNSTIKKWCFRLMPFLVFFLVVLAIRTDFFVYLFKFFAEYVDNDTSNKIISYATRRGRLGFVVPIFIYVLYLLLIKFINTKLIRNSSTFIKRTKVSRLICRTSIIESNNLSLFKGIEQINYVGLIFLPLNVLSLTFYRFVRNICLLDLIYFTVCYDAVKDKKSRAVIFVGVLILVCMWRYFDFSMYLDWEFMYDTYFNASIL